MWSFLLINKDSSKSASIVFSITAVYCSYRCHLLLILLLLLIGAYFYIYNIAVDCGDLTPPPFGQINLPGTTFGSTATYSCNGDRELTGDMTRTCQANGTWSGTSPECGEPLQNLYVQFPVVASVTCDTRHV